MKATEFSKFFDFTIEEIDKETYNNETEYGDYFDYTNGSTDRLFRVSDDQCVFRPRYISKLEDLTECFDSMLGDYIDTDLEYNGFECDDNSNKSYYEQAIDWLEGNNEYGGTWLQDVIKCLTNPELIEDDVERR